MKRTNQQEKIIIKPKVYFPIFIPRRFEKVSYEDLRNTLEEIEELSGIISFNIWGKKSGSAEIKLFHPEEAKSILSFEDTSLRVTTLLYFLLSFSQEITITDFSVEYSSPDIDELPLQDRILLHKQVSSENFASEIKYFLFLTHIAKPGHIRAGDGKLFYDKTNSKNIEGVSCSLEFALEVAEKMRWPQIHQLPINDVWQWATSFKCGTNGFGHSPVGRALAAFSHLFERSSSNSFSAIELFWSLVGLEALYTKGDGGFTQQLVEKSTLLLGKQQEYKKFVKDMYNYRSRFVHGDIPFPSYFFEGDATPEYENFFSESSNCVEISTVILLATLQELVIRKWHSLEFEHKYFLKKNKV